ncbi:MAG: efflux RND transporter periplasmic adaptor subunit [Lachnospiraceae bacterium]
MKERIKNVISKEKLKKLVRSKKFRIILIIVIVVLVAGKIVSGKLASKKEEMQNSAVRTATVERRDIYNTLESTGTISPLDSYEVTSLVQGEVIKCTFEEGDQVKKGDVLYQISTSDIDNNIKTAKKNLSRAKDSYEDALEKLDDLKVKSTSNGYIKELYVEVGDTLQAGSKIADIYDNTYMYVDVMFNDADVSSAWVGRTAKVTLQDTGEKVNGTVTQVSGIKNTLTGNRIVRAVTIRVKNPGGIAAGTEATATVSGITCNSGGTFEAAEETSVMATASGEISSLAVREGSYIYDDQIMLYLDSDEIDNQVKSAKQQYEDAQDNYDQMMETLEDYTITAPIDGEIITKNTKVGDKLSSGANGAATMCTIYDMSAVTFEMSIDELDILNVETNMKVNVTADALEGETYVGYVQNISLESTASGGVTQYPVTVKIKKIGNLLPGMNVTGEIVLDSASDVLAVPSSALMRGDVVYVKDDSLAGAQSADAEQADRAMPQVEMPEGGMPQGKGIPEGYTAVKVEVGIDDGSYIEIKSGLEEGQTVYVQTSDSSSNNMMMGGFGMNGMPGGMSGGPGGMGGNRPGGGNHSGGNAGGPPN